MVAVSTPRVTVVIPTYGRPDLLRKALLSVFKQDLDGSDYEIVVVDSSPDDENVRVIEELGARSPCALRCFRKNPEGPGPSRNLGVQQARAKIIAFLDSDCQASPGWLRSGVAGFSGDVGLVQGCTRPDPSGRLGVLTHYLSVEHESFFYETANIFYRRRALEQAGGFPADLLPTADRPLGGEDTEVAWNVIRLGWRTAFCPAAMVYHAVMPLKLWKWLFIERLFVVPRLTRRFPELRRFMVWRYFFDRAQAWFVVALAGLAFAGLHPAFLVLVVPYAVFRASEPTKTLGGFLRPLRVPPYFLRDSCSFLILAAGSVRYRSLLL